MATYRFDLDENFAKRLEDEAAENHMSVQQYIRYKLFGVKTIFTVDEVIRRVQAGDFDGKEISVPDLYTDEEWVQINRGTAGVLGRRFNECVNDHPEYGIRYVGMARRAVYTYDKKNATTLL